MRKPKHRRAANRRGLRYPSDLTDAEWSLIGWQGDLEGRCSNRRVRLATLLTAGLVQGWRKYYSLPTD